MNIKNLLAILTICTLSLSCNTTKKVSPSKTNNELQELVTIMQGTYSSEKQSLEYKSYYNS